MQTSESSTVVFRLEQHEHDCEDCGSHVDTHVTISLNGQEIGRFFRDGHFGGGHALSEIEETVVTALNVPIEVYEAMLIERASLNEKIQQSSENSEHRARAKYQKRVEQLFYKFLRGQGFTVVEEKEEKWIDFYEIFHHRF